MILIDNHAYMCEVYVHKVYNILQTKCKCMKVTIKYNIVGNIVSCTVFPNVCFV